MHIQINMSEQLPQLRYLLNDLHSVQTKWYGIGIQLNIDEGTLDGIESCKHPPDTALRLMLQKWRNGNENPSLTDLLEALRSPAIKELFVANTLEEKYVGSSKKQPEGMDNTADECKSPDGTPTFML